MQVAVIGANGQLGTDLCRVLADQKASVLPMTRREIDVSDSAHVERILGALQADIVISTVAFHKVEECEKQPAPAFAVNAIGIGLTSLWINGSPFVPPKLDSRRASIFALLRRSSQGIQSK